MAKSTMGVISGGVSTLVTIGVANVALRQLRGMGRKPRRRRKRKRRR